MHFSGLYIETIRFHQRPLVIDETMFSKLGNFRLLFYKLASQQWFEKVRKTHSTRSLIQSSKSFVLFLETDKKEKSDCLDGGFIARYTYNHLRRGSIRSVMLTLSMNDIHSFLHFIRIYLCSAL